MSTEWRKEGALPRTEGGGGVKGRIADPGGVDTDPDSEPTLKKTRIRIQPKKKIVLTFFFQYKSNNN